MSLLHKELVQKKVGEGTFRSSLIIIMTTGDVEIKVHPVSRLAKIIEEQIKCKSRSATKSRIMSLWQTWLLRNPKSHEVLLSKTAASNATPGIRTSGVTKTVDKLTWLV